jgi:hypothetical protein
MKTLEYVFLITGLGLIVFTMIAILHFPHIIRTDQNLILLIVLGMQLSMVAYLFNSLQMPKDSSYRRQKRKGQIRRCVICIVACAVLQCMVLSTV